MSEIRFDERVAIITGAGNGLGRSYAHYLSARGARILVNDLGGGTDGEGGSTRPADQVVEEIRAAGGEATANYDSVASAQGGEAIVETALKAYGKVDIVINNAGILRDRMVFNMTEEEWDAVLGVHLKGAFNTTRAAVGPMLKQGHGRILLFSSGSGLGASGQANYSAAKAGMVGCARALARELGPYGIAANAIYPVVGAVIVWIHRWLASRFMSN